MAMPYPIQNRFGETVEPTGHIRERIAASIYASKPSQYEVQMHYDVRLRDPVGWYLFNLDQGHRKFAEEWADYLLVALDNLGLQLTERDDHG
ncbi:hypothetical protein [Nitrobacter winogradskyi]|uniref:Uncharacterized protein n=2 Tax=Nitrobacter winogradskyi TaxID=913 RepID=A0ACC6AGH3_NITWI|nr:hypothetical protein [Nitrobacter winogradskyi]MCP1998799.1 hypothetical protein [Nitrobacter winogradskyi]GEC14279.1 hypothetical protein NWI01_01710 [Nitrobacter winogradskyi]